MNSQIARQLLIKEVQNEFSSAYPFLKIDFTRGKGEKRTASGMAHSGAAGTVEPMQGEHDEVANEKARKLLWDDFGVTDDMKVSELELLLQYEFGLPAQLLRKSGKLWLETRMTQHWTLRQQDDHGRDMANITDF
ncbi:MAG: hypothetical protein J0H74_32950 [Chitinophagaceae bacterium]|nr:hypothetical protein [Chitinophagaceae bacterium]